MKGSTLTAQRRNACLAAAFLVVMQVSCCQFDAQERMKDTAASEWIREWTFPYDWIQTNSWRLVPVSNFPQAEALLRNRPFVKLDDKQTRELLGPTTQPVFSGAAYLVRGVGDARDGHPAPLEVYTRTGGDIWVGGGAISQCKVARQRRAVIVWLDSSPRDIFVTFEVAR